MRKREVPSLLTFFIFPFRFPRRHTDTGKLVIYFQPTIVSILATTYM